MTLSSVLVQREVATMRQVEEALARQVVYGGDLATNLLEVALVDEEALTGLIAEAAHIAPAPAGELPMAPEPAQLIPLEVAAKRGIVPIALEGEILVLAVIEPMPPDLEEQLMFALGVAIEQRAAPAVRVHQAIARLYRQPLDTRMRRLVARLSGQGPPSGMTPMPTTSVVAPGPARVPSPFPRRPTTGTPPLGTPLARIALADRGDRSGIEKVGSAPAPASSAPSRRRSSGALPAIQVAVALPESAECETHPVTSGPDAETQSRILESVPPPTPILPERRAGLLQRDVPPSVRTARRRRGPITLDAAKQEIIDLSERDAVLGLLFDFARQFFDYAALFLVHGDIAEGRDAFGAGATRERVLGIGVPLDFPSLMATARERREAIVGTAPAAGLDAVLLADLQRPLDAQLAVVPIAVRKRVVALFLGDCGDAVVERDDLDQVKALTAVVGRALERIIVQRKRDGIVGGKASDSGPPTARVSDSQRPGAREVDRGVPSPSRRPSPSA